mmetsp:Transcript_26711/g.39074  ORF Transcript_26711/g.39074 Transcript_26711/m.39074 type:complete len:118 (+) Transcript_26711:957-1310(+)
MSVTEQVLHIYTPLEILLHSSKEENISLLLLHVLIYYGTHHEQIMILGYTSTNPHLRHSKPLKNGESNKTIALLLLPTINGMCVLLFLIYMFCFIYCEFCLYNNPNENVFLLCTIFQ